MTTSGHLVFPLHNQLLAVGAGIVSPTLRSARLISSSQRSVVIYRLV